MSDQAQEQSIEDRFQALLSPEEPEAEEVEQETAPQDNVEDSPESEDEATQEEQGDTEEEDDDSDLVEAEYGGKTYQVPAELKDALMLHADYTRKTQEVAEQRKALEAEVKNFQMQAQIQQQNVQGIAQLMLLDNQLQQYQNIDWGSLYDNDPAEFVRQKEAARDLQTARSELANQLGAIQQQQAAEQQHQLARAQEEARRELTSALKWNAEKAKSTAEYIRGFNLPDSAYADLNNGAYGHIPIIWAHKAMLYDKLQSSKGDASKKVATLPKVSKPGKPQANVTQQAQNDARARLRKSGSIDDAAALFLSRMK